MFLWVVALQKNVIICWDLVSKNLHEIARSSEQRFLVQSDSPRRLDDENWGTHRVDTIDQSHNDSDNFGTNLPTDVLQRIDFISLNWSCTDSMNTIAWTFLLGLSTWNIRLSNLIRMRPILSLFIFSVQLAWCFHSRNTAPNTDRLYSKSSRNAMTRGFRMLHDDPSNNPTALILKLPQEDMGTHRGYIISWIPDTWQAPVRNRRG